MKHALILLVAAVACVVLLLSEDGIRPVEAAQFTRYKDDSRGALYDLTVFNGLIVTSDNANNRVNVYNATSGGYLRSITVTTPETFFTWNNKLYIQGLSNLYEIDPSGGYVTRSLGITSDGNGVVVGNNFFTTRRLTDNVYKVDLTAASLSITNTYTLNTTQCDGPFTMRYLSDVSNLIMDCRDGTPKIAMYDTSLTFIASLAHSVNSIATPEYMGPVDTTRHHFFTEEGATGGRTLAFSYNSTAITFVQSVGSAPTPVGYTINALKISGTFLYYPTNAGFAVADLTNLNTVAAFDLNWDGETTWRPTGVYIDSSADKYYMGVDAGTKTRLFVSALSSLTAGYTQTVTAGGSVGVDTNGDGVPDFTLHDTNGDGVPDWDASIVPIKAADFATTTTNLIQSLGFDSSTAGLLITIGIIVVAEAILFIAARSHFGEIPIFIHGLIVFLSLGAAVAMGLIDIFYLLFGAIACAAAFAFGMSGVIGGGSKD